MVSSYCTPFVWDFPYSIVHFCLATSPNHCLTILLHWLAPFRYYCRFNLIQTSPIIPRTPPPINRFPSPLPPGLPGCLEACYLRCSVRRPAFGWWKRILHPKPRSLSTKQTSISKRTNRPRKKSFVEVDFANVNLLIGQTAYTHEIFFSHNRGIRLGSDFDEAVLKRLKRLFQLFGKFR